MTEVLKKFRVARGTRMTPELLAKYINKHKAIVNERNRKLDEAYKNDYEIVKQKRKPDWKPDNRITVNFAKYIADTMNGFFIGIPIKITSSDERVREKLEFLDAYNSLDDHNAELSKICDKFGEGYEIYFVDEDSQIGIAKLSPMEAFFIYDESILERALYFVRYFQTEDNVEHGSWSDDSVVQHFVNRGSYVWTDEPEPHGFDGIPATCFLENEESIGLYESVMPMINAFNKALSEKANDVDYFADAYLKVLGTSIDKDDTQHIRNNRIINFDGDAQQMIVEFMQKPSGDESQEHLLDRLQELIFMTSMVANISDENFGSSSGISLKYKLQAMSNLAKTKERKFKKGLQRRYRTIFSNPIMSAGGQGINGDSWLSIDYQFTRNYPANLADEAATASTLAGIVSQKTQLSVLSIIDNPENEIQRIQEEEDKLRTDAVMQRTFGGDIDE